MGELLSYAFFCEEVNIPQLNTWFYAIRLASPLHESLFSYFADYNFQR